MLRQAADQALRADIPEAAVQPADMIGRRRIHRPRVRIRRRRHGPIRRLAAARPGLVEAARAGVQTGAAVRPAVTDNQSATRK